MNFKSELVAQRFDLLCDKMKEIAQEMNKFCEENNQVFVITETVTTKEHDDSLNRASSSHRECRAIDVRLKDWSQDFIKTFIQRFSEIYGELGAIGASSGIPNFIVDKSKTKEPHFHIQLNRSFAKKSGL